MKILKVPDFNEIEFGSHFKNNENTWKFAGEILEFCQSGKVGTMKYKRQKYKALEFILT